MVPNILSMLKDYKILKRSLKRHIHKSKKTLARIKARAYEPSNSIKAKILKAKQKHNEPQKNNTSPSPPSPSPSLPSPSSTIGQPTNTSSIINKPNVLLKGGSSSSLQSLPLFSIIYLNVNNNIPILDGIQLTKSQSRAPPIGIKFNDTRLNKNSDYLLVLMDNDIPNGMNSPQRKSFLHQVIQYNPATKTMKFPVRYFSPTPPAGVHRYVFTLYDISKKTKISQDPPIYNQNQNQNDRIQMASKLNKYLEGLKPIGATLTFTVNSSST